MIEPAPLVEARNLSITYATPTGTVWALDRMDLVVGVGETIGIVGESGSGKSSLALAIGRLLPSNARHIGGSLAIEGRDVFSQSSDDVRHLRRDTLGFVFQNPMEYLDPTRVIRLQVADALGRNDRAEIEAQLELVGLPDPSRVARKLPHELSGGMAQRVMIAMAISRRPKVIIADEPTASLDASTRRHILDTLFALPRSTGASVLLVTHDLKSVAQHCARVVVMYGGRSVETSSTRALFAEPRHPYTRALLASAPGNEGREGGRLAPIPGAPPTLTEPARLCTFSPRCSAAIDSCFVDPPPVRGNDDHRALCHLPLGQAEQG